MNLTIIPTPNFIKSVKKLAKKYKRIAQDLEILQHELTQETYTAVDLGNHCFKIRLANASIPTGKSGGFRVVFFKKIAQKIYLLEIYSKTELENISDEKLVKILRENGL
jgi:hypothetical protein